MSVLRRSSSPYFDKDGKPLTLEGWAQKFEDWSYKNIAQTYLTDGTKISTVWLGLNHNYGDGPPLIFETMVFGAEEKTSEPLTEPMKLPPFKYHEELDMERYSTLKQAINGHLEMVTKWKAKQNADIDTTASLS